MVSGRRTMMDVNDKDSYNDRESDKDHDKKQILSYQRNDFRGRRNDLFNDEKKDSERHKTEVERESFSPSSEGR